jgi:NDMA-dependent alcohol dehydrogenase
VPGRFEVVELDVDDPRQGEIRVRVVATGLCHSDDHHAKGDQRVAILPFAGGHEGAGIVEAVGPSTTGFAEGDHVVFSFLPSCGRCRWCATGHQNLCDLGASLGTNARWDDPTSFRLSLDGQPVGQMCGVSTFVEHTTVSTASAVKIDPSIPLDIACLTGCGVGTGWGAAVNSAEVAPGHVVIVMGVGGIGINAVQGAAMAGAKRVIAVDPVEFKREKAMEFGATHTFASMEEAMPAVTELTWGQMAEKVIMTPGVMYGELMELGTKLAGKGGTIVVTAVAPMSQTESSINLFELAMWNKEIKGTIFGSLNPRHDIPKLLGLYREGQLKLDELITRRYPLEGINDGYEAMRQGENIRGVVVHE